MSTINGLESALLRNEIHDSVYGLQDSSVNDVLFGTVRFRKQESPMFNTPVKSMLRQYLDHEFKEYLGITFLEYMEMTPLESEFLTVELMEYKRLQQEELEKQKKELK